jgi:hypothetical protein
MVINRVNCHLRRRALAVLLDVDDFLRELVAMDFNVIVLCVVQPPTVLMALLPGKSVHLNYTGVPVGLENDVTVHAYVSAVLNLSATRECAAEGEARGDCERACSDIHRNIVHDDQARFKGVRVFMGESANLLSVGAVDFGACALLPSGPHRENR